MRIGEKMDEASDPSHPSADYMDVYIKQEDPDLSDDETTLDGQDAANDTLYASSPNQDKNATSNHSVKEVRKRRFCLPWLIKFPWLHYDKDKNLMFCKLCLRYCSESTNNNSFIKGNCCFKMESINSHAGSLDHQMAEKADKLCKPPISSSEQPNTGKNMTEQQKFLLEKYLRLFSWLLYRADLQTIICELCYRNTKNTLFLDAAEDIDFQILDHHRRTRHHVVAEVTEVKSWSIAWEGLTRCELPTEMIHDFEQRNDDYQRRCSMLPVTEPVAVSSSVPGISSLEPDRQNASDFGETSTSNALHNGSSSDLEDQSLSQNAELNCARGYYLPKKPKLTPVFGTFRTNWLSEFPWLHYDSQQNIMKCKLCQKHKKKLGFSRGVRVFSRSYIVGHMSMKKHLEAVNEELIEDSSVLGSDIQDASLCSAQSDSGSSSASFNPLLKTESTEEVNNHYGAPISDASPDTADIASGNLDNSPTPNKRRKRQFSPNWTLQFPWVEYNQDGDFMMCSWCVKQNFASAFTRGCRTFQIDSLRAHDGSQSHQQAAHMELSNSSPADSAQDPI